MDIETFAADGILTIAFNRPERKNAVTAAMYAAMADALHEAGEDPSIRVVLFAGRGGTFCAGNDIEDFLHAPPQDGDSPVFRFLHQLAHAPKPLVAAVGGAAVGIGVTLLLHCDLVYAADDARFSFPFTRLGLCPEAASTLLLPQIAGHQRAAEKLLLGDPFSAQEACELGFVSRVLPAAELDAHARGQALRLAALPPSALRATKRLMKQGSLVQVDAQMQAEGDQFRRMLSSPEAREAFTAFFEKRKPDFSRFG